MSSKPPTPPLQDAPSADMPSLSTPAGPAEPPAPSPAPSRPSSPPPCPPPPPPSPVGRVQQSTEEVLSEPAPVSMPEVPKRDYSVVLPQVVLAAPSSRLPAMLKALAGVMTYVGAGSAALILLYLRFILPLLSRTLSARTSLSTHTSTLLTSLSALLAALPSPCPPCAPHPILALPSAVHTISTRPDAQHALQSLAGLTSYVSARTYGLGARERENGVVLGEIENARREVRAIRGLVLNRRSFAPVSTNAVSTA